MTFRGLLDVQPCEGSQPSQGWDKLGVQRPLRIARGCSCLGIDDAAPLRVRKAPRGSNVDMPVVLHYSVTTLSTFRVAHLV